ncbi:MAG: substrate-binding domain-containing protein [Phycisphaerae bacterium]
MDIRSDRSSDGQGGRILVAIDRLDHYTRGMLEGVGQFAQQHGHLWTFDMVSPMSLLRQAKPQAAGLLLHSRDPNLIRRASRSAVPAVAITSAPVHGKLAQVGVDEYGCAKQGVQHFLDRGFGRFAYAGPFWSDAIPLRRASVQRRLKELSFEMEILGPLEDASTSAVRHSKLIHWLKKLPRPVAVFAWNDLHGSEVVSAARSAGLLVPEDVAVLGMDNDAVICSLCNPPLSSIMQPLEQIGHKAMEMLDQIMQGDRDIKELYLPSPGVAQRRSTEVFAVDDEDVRTALSFIHANAEKNIGVADVLEAVPLARRTLEKRFRQKLGRTINAEIRTAHIQRARSLLATTDLSVTEIAFRSGFNQIEHFSRVFRKLCGLSAREYRKRFRA